MADPGSFLAALLATLTGVVFPPTPVQPGAPGTDASQARPLTAADALRVRAEADGTKVLRTADGRSVQLRGANVNALVDYGGVHQTVPVTAQDGRQARALGFNVVRLAVSWSKLEPAPGTFSAAYVDEIERAARVFADQGVYVLLDLHQDRYAAGLGPSGDESDGAPSWAAKTDDASDDANSGGHPYYGTAAARAAARNFFENAPVAGKGVQEHYADAVARLAAVGADLGPALAGVEVFNEPIDPVATDPRAADTFSKERLWPLYDRLIRRLRGADGRGPGAGAYDGPIWFEPTATRTQTDRDAAAADYTPAAFADANLVYGPHVYTDIFGASPNDGTLAKLAGSFDAAADEARTYGAALAPTELPGASGGAGVPGTGLGAFELHRAAVLRHLDRLQAGGIVWVWKQHPEHSYGWGVLNADGSARTDSGIARDYGRPRVQSSGPAVLSQTWDRGVLTVQTSGAGDVDLWDGAAFSGTPPTAGTAPSASVDGAPAALRSWRAQAALQSDRTWVGGRQLRVTVSEGRHTIVLRPGTPTAPSAGDPADPTPGGSTGPTPGGPTGGGTGTTPAPGTGTDAAPGSTTSPSAGAPASGAASPVASITDALARLLTTLNAPSSIATRPGTTSSPGVAAASRPRAAVSSLRVAPRRFAPAGATASGGGTVVSVAVVGTSRVRVALQRVVVGRRSSGRCVATGGPSRAARCRTHVTVSTTTRAVARGRASVRLTGRSGRAALRPGAYRLLVTPLAADGARGAARTAALTILPAAR